MKRNYKSVLLVDDDQVSCFINERILKTFGVTALIHTVNNGQEALNFMQENDNNYDRFPDLILLDLHMPVMNGFEFMEDFLKLSYQGEAPKILILTSSANPVDKEKVEQYPIMGYINKPLRFEELTKVFA